MHTFPSATCFSFPRLTVASSALYVIASYSFIISFPPSCACLPHLDCFPLSLCRGIIIWANVFCLAEPSPLKAPLLPLRYNYEGQENRVDVLDKYRHLLYVDVWETNTCFGSDRIGLLKKMKWFNHLPDIIYVDSHKVLLTTVNWNHTAPAHIMCKYD